MADLAQTRQAIARVNTGKKVNEDSWMTMWCSTNWGDLLQPAPLSIALLGSIMVIAASTDDFSLLDSDSPEPYKWKYADFPGSFKACLMQMVNEGYTAFGTAHTSMIRIQNASSQLPDVIKTAVYTVVKASPSEMRKYLPDQIESALELANICVSAAKASEAAFRGIQNLAAELVVACTNQVGTSEQKLAANQIQLEILEEQKKSDEERVRTAKETNAQMQNSLRTAEEDFHTAIKNIPTGWDLVGMQVVEGLTNLVSSAGNAVLSVATLKPLTDLGKSQRATPQPEASRTSGSASSKSSSYVASISDPAISEVHNVLHLSKTLQQLLSGGPNGSPEWDKIRGDGSTKSKTGATYVSKSLEVVKKRLAPTKPISDQLLLLVNDGLNISKGITTIANSIRASDDSCLNEYKPQVEALVTKVEHLVTVTNLILQQSGAVASGPGTPPTPPKASGSATRMAVDNARYKVDQTRANLEASREAYNQASEKLLEQQKQIGETIAHLTGLSLTNAGIKAMLPVLKKAIASFTTMRAQFSQITQFFESVTSLLSEVLQPSVARWAKTMNNNATLGGVKVGDFARQLIYTQMMVPLKVSMLSEKIATVYLEVSDKHIMPAQRSVGGMMEFTDDPSEEGRKVLRASLERKQVQLQQQSKAASDYISDLVARDQKKFISTIDHRLDDIQTALQGIFPTIAEPVPARIQEVTSEYVNQFAEMRDNAAKENPMFDFEDLI